MNVVVLACLSRATGNNSTAKRIRDHLLSNDLNATLQCANVNLQEFKNFLCEGNVDAIVGVHAYRSGKLLQDCDIPYVIVFGGTDLNEHFKNANKLKVMSKAVKNARLCIAFSEPLKKQAERLWPGIEKKIIIQPQAFSPRPSRFMIQEDLRFLERDHADILNNNALVFLLVAGLRPVKDPLFLVDVVSAWHAEDKRIHLVIIGPELDEEYSLLCKKEISRLSGVVLLDPINPDTLGGFMKNAFALVNTSTSEGMANSILEAMSLGTPVLARRNDGNESIITHRENGFLFDTPQDFKNLAEELISCESLQKNITKNARCYISQHHSLENERTTYNNIIQSLTTRI